MEYASRSIIPWSGDAGETRLLALAARLVPVAVVDLDPDLAALRPLGGFFPCARSGTRPAVPGRGGCRPWRAAVRKAPRTPPAIR